ncbi:Pet20 protein [Saccharomycopsis crataegensis]|uniref:Pet20 protein n=1 Tax=Saccharomycopsis crataegensis TaxID=43959 RepID=A0AAV5QHJ3_9ASCO|nr:Pet20 protein [Saccharomycopsis crataegensis]
MFKVYRAHDFRLASVDRMGKTLSQRFSSTTRTNNSPIITVKKAHGTTATSSTTAASQTNSNSSTSSTSGGPQNDAKAGSQQHQETKASEQDKSELDGRKRQQKMTQVDYSWLPKAPKLKSFSPRELRLQSLYSGYRPLFMEYRKNASKLDSSDGQLLLDEEPSVWSYSATEMDYYSEWENIPTNVSQQLKPFELTLDDSIFDKKIAKNEQDENKKNASKDSNSIRENEGQSGEAQKAKIVTSGRKRYLPERYQRTIKSRAERKLELKRLLQKKSSK